MSGLYSKLLQAHKMGFKEVEVFVKKSLLPMCQAILERSGPFHKEGTYQSLLMHELGIMGVHATKEWSFGMKFKDSLGKEIRVGDNQSLRTDIELDDLSGLLELKATHSKLKDENIWQLKNYLDQRPELTWGVVINFISKYTDSESPKVEMAFMYKIEDSGDVKELIHNGNKMIRYWYEDGIESEQLPDQGAIFFDHDINA